MLQKLPALLLGGALVAVACCAFVAAEPHRTSAPSHRTAVTVTPFSPSDVDPGKTHLRIDKSAYEMHLYEGDVLLKTYPVVLGPNPIDDKMQEGDGCTPEGRFRIQSKYPHNKWSHFLWIDYPNDSSWEKFRRRKREGILPPDATIGGEIGIHGVPAGQDDILDKGINWTLGCISVRNAHIQEIYPLVQEGRVVDIER